MTPKKPRIGIVGAGPAGLAAAWRLQRWGFDTVVFEAEAQAGGRSRSLVSGGAVHDLGAWTFTHGSAVHRLAEDAGLSGRVVTIPTTVGRPAGGQLAVGCLDRPVSLLGSVFTPAEIARIGQALVLGRTTTGRSADGPAADWCRRRFPAAFRRNVLEPLAGLYFLQTLDTLSRDALLQTLAYLAKVRLLSFQGGMGLLAATLAGRVPVQTGRKVRRLALSEEGVVVVGAGFRETVAGVVAAAPLPEVARLLAPWLPASARDTAGRWPYAATVTVRLLLEGRWERKALQVLPPRGWRGMLCGVTMERAKGPGRVPPGCELVTLYARPDRVVGLARVDDGRLVRRFAGELRQWMGAGRVRVRRHWVGRWHRAAAYCDPPAAQRQVLIRRGLAVAARRIPAWAAGDFLMGSGLDGAIASGVAAAEACRRHFSE